MVSMARSAPNSLSRSRRSALVDVPMTRRAPMQLGDLQAHQADAGAGALDQDASPALRRPVGDDGVVHGLQRDGQRRRLLPAHVVGRDRRRPGPNRRRRTRRSRRRPSTSRGRPASRVVTSPPTATTSPANSMPTMPPPPTLPCASGRDGEVGAVQPARAHPHQHLLRRGPAPARRAPRYRSG